MDYFNDGFTELSYFNICKILVCDFYKQYTNTDTLKFFFSEDKEVNACATLDKLDNDILIINAGTIVEIFALMKTAFCHRNIFCDIGNVSEEKNKIVEGQFDGYKRQITYTSTPQDIIREEISTYCSFNYLLKFVALHEIGHIVDGHTRLLNTIYMRPEIHMRLEKFWTNEKYCLDRRTLEMDADAVAISAIFDNVATTYLNFENTQFIGMLKKAEDIFRLWAFSIATLFMYFETKGDTTYNPSGYYLPNEARFKLVMLAAYNNAQMFVKHGVNTKLQTYSKEIICSVIQGIEEAEYMFGEIYEKKFNWSRHFVDRDFDVHSQIVLDNWNKRLCNKLKEFAKAPLYNPDLVDEQFKKAMTR